MKQQILCVGTGGQGVIWLTRVLAEAASELGLHALTAETHGMAMRGGSVVCHAKLGAFASPLIVPGRADVLLALNATEADRHLHYLTGGGVAVVQDRDVDAQAVAISADAPRAANAALLGFALGSGVLALDEHAVARAVAAASPPAHSESSMRAFEAGKTAAAGPA